MTSPLLGIPKRWSSHAVGKLHASSSPLFQRFGVLRHRGTKVFLEVVLTTPRIPQMRPVLPTTERGEGTAKDAAFPSSSSFSKEEERKKGKSLDGWGTSSFSSSPLRLEMELFSTDTPVAAKHFEDFCTGTFNKAEGEADDVDHQEVDVGPEGLDGAEGLFPSSSSRIRPSLCYQYSTFHRLHKGFLLQGGDVYSSEGVHQISLFGEDTYDAPEETKKSFFSQPSFHSSSTHRGQPYSPKGLIGTAVSAPHLNGSQFFILTTTNPQDVAHLDQTCICFGKVLESSFPVLDEIERRVVVEAGGEIMEGYRIEIVNCGLASSR